MVDRVPKHFAQLVVGLAHDAVRAEEVGERPPARKLGDEHDRSSSDDDAVEQTEGRERHPHALTAEQREQKRGSQERGNEHDGLDACRSRDTHCDQERDLPARSRPLENEGEEQSADEEDRIERVLRHDRARVDERGERDGEHGSEQRESSTDDAAGEQVGGDRGQGHDERVQRLHRGVGVGQTARRPRRPG